MDSTPRTFARLFEANAAAAPDEAAILAPDQLPLSNLHLYEQAITTVARLNQMGLGRGNRVAIVAPSGPALCAAFVSVSCGTTCAVLNPASRPDELMTLFTQMRIDALIYQEPVEATVLKVAQQCGLIMIQMTVQPEDGCGRFRLHGEAREQVKLGGLAEPDDIAMLLPTSGTTGSSKIVPISHRVMVARLGPKLGTEAFPQGRLLHVMPMFHYSGQGYLIRTLASGGSVVCLPGFEIDSFFAALEAFKPIGFGGVATMLQSIVDHADAYREIIQHHTLRYIRADGMALPPTLKLALEALFGVPVMQLYASTEAGIIARSAAFSAESKAGSVGKVFHVEVKIVDEHGQALPNGQAGEILVRGEAVIQGYAYNPDRAEDIFRDGWYHTGDLGYFDVDSDLFITGRVKEMINRGGQKVSPAEVERVLVAHPSVQEVAVFGLPDAQLGEEIGAAIVTRDGTSGVVDALRQFAGAQLADYKVPRHFFFVRDIPKTSLGKVERHKLVTQFKKAVTTEAETPVTGYAAPQTPLESALVAIWADVLKKPSAAVGVQDTFRALGGTSLSAARIVFKMREQFQLDVKLVDLFDAPTIRQQAAVITRLQASRTPLAHSTITLIPIHAEGNRPPLYCLHALEGGVYLYRDLAAYLDPEQPVYGLQAVGLDDGRTPLDSIEAMCAYHLAQIEAVQPNGPYELLGYSLGGRLALEIARKLREKGHRDVHLMMIDVHVQTNIYAPTGSTPLGWGQGKLLNRLYNFLFAMFRLPARYKALYLRERWRYLTALAKKTPERARPPEKLDITLMPPTVRSVMEAADRAAKAYVPRPYDGDITYLRAAGDIINIPMFRALYYQAVGSLTIIDVPGTHYDVLREPHIRTVAAELRKWLDAI